MENKETLKAKLFERINNDKTYSKDDIDLINKAYNFAEKKHSGMKRLSGDEYITHPISVAYYCMCFNSRSYE